MVSFYCFSDMHINEHKLWILHDLTKATTPKKFKKNNEKNNKTQKNKKTKTIIIGFSSTKNRANTKKTQTTKSCY